jgi:glycosyltransferase involved in cell wall biosynthesis
VRVAIDTSYVHRGHSGTAVYVERLMAALRNEGVDVVELRQPLRGRRGGANKLRSAANAALDLTWTRSLLPRAAARAEADVLHHPLPAVSPGSTPQVVTVHDVAFARRPDDFDRVWRRIAMRGHRAAVANAGAVVAVSQTTARDAVAWLRVAPERVVVAPHGPGQELSLPDERRASHFLYVGDDEPRKNVAALVAAHANYSDKGGALPLVLAGRAASSREINIDVAMRRGCGSRVIAHPDPTPAALTDLYAHAAALVHASHDEGFGLTILEAMATGTPVVAVRNAAIEELTKGAALIVEEPVGLADAMRRIEHEPALRDRLSTAGLERAAAFTWQQSARAHIEAYTLARDSR